MPAKESIYFTKNQIQGSVRFIKRTIFGTLAHQTTYTSDERDKKNKSIDDRWKGSNARTHRLGHLLSRRILSAALELLSNTKKMQHFHLPFFTFLLKKVNRKVQGVPQAQVAASTMMAGSKT